MIPTDLPFNVPDVRILPPDALEVGELELEAREAGGEHRVGFCDLHKRDIAELEIFKKKSINQPLCSRTRPCGSCSAAPRSTASPPFVGIVSHLFGRDEMNV